MVIRYDKDKSELAVVFSRDHDTFNLMNFDLAKKLAGEKQLPAEFSAGTLGRGDRFGVINLGDADLWQKSTHEYGKYAQRDGFFLLCLQKLHRK